MTAVTPARVVSDRQRLLALARAIAAGDLDVVAVDAVTCMAAPVAGYDVTLSLTCRPVALAALGDRIAGALRAAAATAGLAAALTSVAVVVTDVVEAAA